MPIDFVCKNCQSVIRTPDDTAGKMARCPNCRSVMPIPAPSSEMAATPPAALADSTNPFSDLPPSVPAADPTNPYAAPSAMPPVAPRPPMDPTQILSQLKAPAIVLLVSAIFGTLYWLGSVGFVFIDPTGPIRQAADATELAGAMVGVLIVLAPLLIVEGLTIIGAISMLRGTSYRWSMAGAIAGLMPCFPCCLLSFGFAIWALVILMKPESRWAFQ